MADTVARQRPAASPALRRAFTAAIVASCLGLVLPLVLKWMVDGPVRDGDTTGVEAGIIGVRRRLVARPLAAVEASMREAFLRHRWPPGQLLSRGTADLQSLHVFLAVPLTFLPVNAVTPLVGCALSVAQQWLLGLVFRASALPLLTLGPLLEARYARASRQVREQNGDLTTAVTESVLGIRVVKSFGHQRGLIRTFQRRAARLRGTELRKARLLATLSALPAALALGAAQVADGETSSKPRVARRPRRRHPRRGDVLPGPPGRTSRSARDAHRAARPDGRTALIIAHGRRPCMWRTARW